MGCAGKCVAECPRLSKEISSLRPFGGTGLTFSFCVPEHDCICPNGVPDPHVLCDENEEACMSCNIGYKIKEVDGNRACVPCLHTDNNCCVLNGKCNGDQDCCSGKCEYFGKDPYQFFWGL